MKEITTKSGKVLLVKDCPGIYEIVKHTTKIKILGKFSELKDEDFEEFCELNNALKEAQKIFPRKDLSIHVDANNWKYTNYLFPHDYYFGLQYAKDSFETLVKSQGLDDNLDNYLIIKVL